MESELLEPGFPLDDGVSKLSMVIPFGGGGSGSEPSTGNDGGGKGAGPAFHIR